MLLRCEQWCVQHTSRPNLNAAQLSYGLVLLCDLFMDEGTVQVLNMHMKHSAARQLIVAELLVWRCVDGPWDTVREGGGSRTV